MDEQFRYCIPLAMVGIMQVLNTHLDKLIVSGYFTSAEFAVYSTGSMEIPIVNIITVSLAIAALPHMSKAFNTNHDINEALQIWGKITITGAAVIFPVFFILGFYHRGYIGFLFSEKYFSCIPVFLIRLLRLPLSCTIFGNLLIIMGKQRVTVINMLISIGINILGNIVLIPSMGIVGATLSGFIMHVSVIILQLIQIGRFAKVKIRHLLPYRDLAKIFGISFIVVFPIFDVSKLIHLPYMAEFFVFGPPAFLISLYVLTKLKFIDINADQKFALLREKAKAYTMKIPLALIRKDRENS
jgi:O-antigen/teichoic acid export membrane protein